jgi:16S rRNA processing protein RimM
LVAIAKIVGVHGLSGELRIHPYIAKDAVDDYLDFFRSIWERLDIGGVPHTLTSLKPHKNILIVKFKELNTRESAEKLRGIELFCERAEFPELTGGEYYECDLVGMDVFTVAGEPLGRLTAVLAAGSSDVYEVNGPLGEVLLPAISDVIVKVDISANRMTVEPLEGLLPDTDGEPGEKVGKRGKAGKKGNAKKQA